jgi:hypothetical protein
MEGETERAMLDQRLAVILAALAAAAHAAPAALRTPLVQALEEFQLGAQADDTAVVIMRFDEHSPDGEGSGGSSGVGAQGNG